MSETIFLAEIPSDSLVCGIWLLRNSTDSVPRLVPTMWDLVRVKVLLPDKMYILNLLDLCFTLHALRHGAWEVNPLMQSVPVMLAWKVGVEGMLWCCLKMLSTRYRSARWGLRFCTAIYAVVDLWHIVNIAVRVAVK